MSKINELMKLKTKPELVGWLVENFSVEQLRSCLKSFESESVHALEQVGVDVDTGAPVMDDPFSFIPKPTVGQACNPFGDEGGFAACANAVGRALNPFDDPELTKVEKDVTKVELSDGPEFNWDAKPDPDADPYSFTFGKLQRFGARRNRYVTTAKRTPSGYKFLTYEFKNGKWQAKGTWKSAKSVLSGKAFRGKTTKKGLTNFFGLKDLYVDSKTSGFGSKKAVFELKSLHPMNFGYTQKAMGDRTYGQLFPLGKYAYVDGLHRGVSSTFSEAVSKKRGLYPPPRAKVANKWTYNQMQFGMAPVNYNYTGSMDPSMFGSDNDLQLEATSYSFGAKARSAAAKAHQKRVKEVGKLMKKGHSMAEAWQMVKAAEMKKPVAKTTKKRKVVKKRKTTKKRKTVKRKVVKKRKTVKRKVVKKRKTTKKRKTVKRKVVKKRKTTKGKTTRKPRKTVKRVVKKKSLKSRSTTKPKFGMKKRSKHCFGKKLTEPNDYGMVKSSYASDFPGIPNSMYGYRGTQPIFGGNTGVVGYSGLGNETVHLLPKTVTRSLRR